MIHFDNIILNLKSINAIEIRFKTFSINSNSFK